jgi:hypothetical protein
MLRDDVTCERHVVDIEGLGALIVVGLAQPAVI